VNFVELILLPYTLVFNPSQCNHQLQHRWWFCQRLLHFVASTIVFAVIVVVLSTTCLTDYLKLNDRINVFPSFNYRCFL
jgi:hypothetical protein